MTSTHYFLLLISSLVNQFGCLNHSTITSTNDQIEDVIDGSGDGPIDVTVRPRIFMQIEDVEMHNSTHENLVLKVKPPRKPARTEKSDLPQCRKFSVREKYNMLEVVGGRNQRYMAETPEEASRGFVSPSSSPVEMKYSDTLDEDEYVPHCNKECEAIRNMLKNVLEKHRPRTRLWGTVAKTQFNDVEQTEFDEDFSTMKECTLVNFAPMNNCTELGSELSRGYEELCSMCRGVYLLSGNCFPQFINSVLCNKHETGCIFDNFSNRAHGVCRTETLSLFVLRNRGSHRCEDWISENIEIPVACQCFLDRESWLQPTPTKRQ